MSLPNGTRCSGFRLERFVFVVGYVRVVAPMGSSVRLALRATRTVLGSSFAIPFRCAVCGSFDASRGAGRLGRTSLGVKFRLIGLSRVASRPSPGCLLILRVTRRGTVTTRTKLLVIRSSIVIGGRALRSLFSNTRTHGSYNVTTTIAMSRRRTVGCPCLCTGNGRGRIFPRGGRLDFYYSLLAASFLHTFSFRSLGPRGG